MGQYYVIANLDQQRYLDPSVFRDGCKLMEFASSSEGVLQALALLTADGNGRGMGDLSRTIEWEATQEKEPKGWKPEDWERVEYEWSCASYSDRPAKKSRIIVPTCVGSWAGDRIVTAGDYGDSGKFIDSTTALIKGLHKACLNSLAKENADREEWATKDLNSKAYAYLKNKPGATEGFPPLGANSADIQRFQITYNLYQFAHDRFVDVSKQVKQAVSSYGQGRNCARAFFERVQELLSSRLTQEYPWRYETKVRGGKIIKYRLYWMTFDMFDGLLRAWHDPADLKLLKMWLRKQILAPWQMSIMRFYQGRVNDVERINHQEIERALSYHGITRQDVRHGPRYVFPPALPAEKFLAAALAVQAKEEPNTGGYWESLLPAEIDGATVEQIGEVAGVAVRSRVIRLR